MEAPVSSDVSETTSEQRQTAKESGHSQSPPAKESGRRTQAQVSSRLGDYLCRLASPMPEGTFLTIPFQNHG